MTVTAIRLPHDNTATPTGLVPETMIATALVDQSALAALVHTYFAQRHGKTQPPELEEFTKAVATIAKTLMTGRADGEDPTQAQEQKPAVKPSKSIQPDFIICLEDGLQFKSLKRHLTGLGLTPEQYREKWNLPSDYPMVAPNYAEKRSELAKKHGLGVRSGRGAAR